MSAANEPEQKSTEAKPGEDAALRKSMFSIFALIAIFAALIYAAPRLQEVLQNFQSDKEQAEVEKVSDKPTLGSPELSTWLPPIEEQLKSANGEERSYRLIHMRLSENSDKLLLDIEIAKSEEQKRRVDVVLERDEFGRYLGGENELGREIKFYPPASVEKE